MTEISEKEIEEALTDNDIKKRIIEEELSKQIVGEEKSIDTILTCCIGSKVKNARLTSFNLLVNDESGVGKDWVVNHVLKIFPKEMWEHRTRISPTAFTYWHNAKFEPEWTWDGKMFYLEDPSNAVLNCSVVKLMASTGSSAVITIKHRAYEVIVNGKPVLLATMARSQPKDETIRRFNMLNLDSGIKQTEAIMDKQTEVAKTGESLHYDPLITECLKYLKRMEVRLPFLEKKKVKRMFPRTVIMRTQYNRFLDYVKAQTILMQLQRKTIQELLDEPEILLGTKEDWNNAIQPFMKTVTNPLFISLPKDDQRLLDIIENMGDQLHFVGDIDEKQTIYRTRWLYDKLKWLAEKGFLEQAKMDKEESKKRVFAYRFLKHKKLKIKRWL